MLNLFLSACSPIGVVDFGAISRHQVFSLRLGFRNNHLKREFLNPAYALSEQVFTLFDAPLRPNRRQQYLIPCLPASLASFRKPRCNESKRCEFPINGRDVGLWETSRTGPC